jgi:hypothetical protein
MTMMAGAAKMNHARVSHAWLWLGVALGASGCGDDGGTLVLDATDTANDTTEVESDTAADGTMGSDAVIAWPNGCDAGPCESGACRSGVCVEDPPEGDLSYTTEPVDNAPTTEWPDLSCVDTTLTAPVQSSVATLYGAVARFGKGRKTAGMKVEVLAAEGFDPSACEAERSVDARKLCYRNYGTPLGTTTSVAAPTPTNLPETCTKHEECPLGYQCFDPSELGGTCEEQFGLYEVSGIPLDTPLIIRTYATSGESQWRDTFVFNVILHSERAVDGRVQYDAQIVSEGQWQLTTNSVGLPDIDVENGAIGGRIRDCAGTREVSWPVADVRLGLANPGRAIVYFNDLEDDTVPLIDRESTDIIGRFAALDVPPGWNRMAGAARVDGAVVSIGAAPVYVMPGALSIVSWPGTTPYWRQQ